MEDTKYVCEPHYDENGNFDYWNPLFPYNRNTCEGCKRDIPYPSFDQVCNLCIRSVRGDFYEPKVVE